MTRQLRIAVLSGLFLLSSLAMVHSVRAQTTPTGPAASQRYSTRNPPVAIDNELIIAYWTTETGWTSELQLRNNLAGQDLVVTPALRLAGGGAETALAPVTIKPQEVASIDLESAIGKTAPQWIGTYGSLVLRYHSMDNSNLYSALMVRRTGHPIAFHIDAMAAEQDYDAGAREGVWWLPKETTTGYLILTNQGGYTLPLVLSLYDANGNEHKQKVVLGSRETSRLSVRTLLVAAGITGSYGGIKVSAASHEGSLDTLHLLYDETAEFSAILKMFDHDPRAKLEERDFAKTSVWTTRAPMLALANPDSALAFPPGTILKPQLFVRNATGKTLDASLRFNWRDTSSTGSAPGPALHLSPFETRRVDVAALQNQGALPKQANWASVILTTNSLPDEVMAVAASYDETMRYGAQTPFNDQLSFKWEGGMWEYDPNHSSIMTAGNGGAKPMQAAFTIYYNQGMEKYELEQTLKPDEQMWMDVGKLIREKVPDKTGKVLPADLTSGSYEFRDLTDRGVGSLYEGKVIYDKTYGSVAYGCAGCCGYRGPLLDWNPLGIPIWSWNPNFVLARDICAGGLADITSDFWNHWNTASHVIATVDANGSHYGASVGTTTTSTFGYYPIPSAYGRCPLNEAFPQGGDNVNCGDVRDTIVGEYLTYSVNLTPMCTNFTQSAHSVYFAFSELRKGDDYSWALIRLPLTVASTSGYGLDRWRENYGAARTANSVYRNPAHNALVGGAAQSRHMYGDAADLTNDSGTSLEWNAMVSAAGSSANGTGALADFVEPLSGPCGLACTHADWRSHSGGYQ
jgi:hypothetical protein